MLILKRVIPLVSRTMTDDKSCELVWVYVCVCVCKGGGREGREGRVGMRLALLTLIGLLAC